MYIGEHREYLRQGLLEIFKNVPGTEGSDTWQILNKPIRVEIIVNERQNSLQAVVYAHVTCGRLTRNSEERVIAQFKIQNLDGSDAYVFSDCSIVYYLQNKGYGVKCHILRLNFAKKTGIPAVIATSNIHNNTQRRIFDKFFWLQVPLYTNHWLWTKQLDNWDENTKFSKKSFV